MQKKNYTPIILFIIIITLTFRNLIQHLTTSFIDWGDTPFIAWQIYITRAKMLTLNFTSITTTNSHYPYLGSLFFTDTFIGQSIMGIPLFFIKNPVTLTNLLFLITILLNYVAAYFLFKKLFKSIKAGVVASILINNSVYFFDQIIHLQTISYWPILIFISLLIDIYQDKFNFKKVIIAGVLLSFQFYLSIYLGILLVFTYGLFLLSYLFYQICFKQTIFIFFKNTFLIFLVFFILTYPFLIKNYLLFEKTYHQVRDINEILINSPHITDYLFPIGNTLFSKLGPVTKFSQFNRHTAPEKLYFPGIVLIISFFFGLVFNKIKVDRVKQSFSWTLFFQSLDVFFLLMIILGFIFSLGPRLNANGKYLEIPLPYLVFLNCFHFLYSIRLTQRWFFLALLGLVYFSVKLLTRLKPTLLIAILLLFFFEAIPINIKAIKMSYIDGGHRYLKNNASKNQVLIEYPFLNLEQGVPIDYETRLLLASTDHKLRLVNGYTGLFINDLGLLRLYLNNPKMFPKPDYDAIIRSLKIDYLKINKRYLTKERVETLKKFYINDIVYEDSDTLIVKLQKYNDSHSDVENVVKIQLDERQPIFLGPDKKFFLDFFYSNPLTGFVDNVDQKKIIVRISFYNDSKKVLSKELYDIYPLYIFPQSSTKRSLSFFFNQPFNQVEIEMLSEKEKTILKKKLTYDK